jgi:hypothetical protein
LREHKGGILASIRLGISNARAEALNTKVRNIIRSAYGFHSAEAAIALVMLACGPIELALPHEGRGLTYIDVRRASFQPALTTPAYPNVTALAIAEPPATGKGENPFSSQLPDAPVRGDELCSRGCCIEGRSTLTNLRAQLLGAEPSADCFNRVVLRGIAT